MALFRYLTKITNCSNSTGRFGEMIVSSIFHPNYFGQEEHYIVNDLYFEHEGKTHQIDHVVIYKTGIFCIETKHIKGMILGNDKIFQWIICRNKRKYKLYNPLLQNEKHIEVLDDFLESRFVINNLVVFTNNNKPKDIGNNVVNVTELREYIKEFKSSFELTSDLMKEVYEILIKHKEETNVDRLEHINNANKYK